MGIAMESGLQIFLLSKYKNYKVQMITYAGLFFNQ